MITVSILINGNPIYTRSAVNVKTLRKDKSGTLCEYTIDNGKKVEHIRENGAVELAKVMLDTIVEVK